MIATITETGELLVYNSKSFYEAVKDYYTKYEAYELYKFINEEIFSSPRDIYQLDIEELISSFASFDSNEEILEEMQKSDPTVTNILRDAAEFDVFINTKDNHIIYGNVSMFLAGANIISGTDDEDDDRDYEFFISRLLNEKNCGHDK